ncbi:MAG: hypothetical protein HQM08_25095 [Candidatus Riflebacteria bacterium]|nr:hypothetical protein [Candidatus Riflebacteria bacterium]
MKKSFMHRISPLIASASIVVLLLACGTGVLAWDNVSPHRQINEYAWSVFLKKYLFGPGEKSRFSASPISTTKLKCMSMVEENVMLPTEVKETSYEMDIPDWIKHGGFSADVPNLAMSIRHFYDPTETGKNAALTDTMITSPNGITTMWGTKNALSEYEKSLEFSGINAREWALNHSGNRFNWQNGLKYYRYSFERDDLKPEERVKLLAEAFKSLGETMHLMADMTCPAHVRNDNHASYKNVGDPDPIELGVGFKVSESAWKNGPWASMIPKGVQLTGTKIEQLFHNVAIFTNEHFLSDDTIYSRMAPSVTPFNSKKNYPKPQLTDLDKRKDTYWTSIPMVDAGTGKTDTGNAEIKLARECSTMDWLSSGSTGKHRSYEVPTCFAQSQANLLIPLAVYACAEMINMFFPTMSLTAVIADLPPDKADMRKIHVEAALTHDCKSDIAWQDQTPILFAGEGRLVRKTENGKEEQMPLIFKKGVCSQDLYVGPKDEIRVEVEAGGRIFSPVNKEDLKEEKLALSLKANRSNDQYAACDVTFFVLPEKMFKTNSNLPNPEDIGKSGDYPPKNAMFKWTIEYEGRTDHDESGAPFLKWTRHPLPMPPANPNSNPKRIHIRSISEVLKEGGPGISVRVTVEMIAPARGMKTTVTQEFWI